MANFDALFPGMESILEGNVEINNDVTVPADEAEVQETAAVTEEVDNAATVSNSVGETEEGAAEAENASMVFDQLFRMHDHVARFGVDRTFLSLYNTNDELTHMLRVRFPSCESMDSVGSPRSSYSQSLLVAMESDDGIFHKFWEWVKKVARKIRDLAVKIWDWLAELFGNLEIRIGKLRKSLENRTEKTGDGIEDKEAKVFIDANFDALLKTMTETVMGSDKTISDLNRQIESWSTVNEDKNFSDKYKPAIKDGEKLSAVKDWVKKIKKLKSDVNDKMKLESKKKSEILQLFKTSDVMALIKGVLEGAANMVQKSQNLKGAIKTMREVSNNMERKAEMQSRLTTGGSRTSEQLKSHREDTALANKTVAGLVALANIMYRLAGKQVSAAANMIDAFTTTDTATATNNTGSGAGGTANPKSKK